MLTATPPGVYEAAALADAEPDYDALMDMYTPGESLVTCHGVGRYPGIVLAKVYERHALRVRCYNAAMGLWFTGWWHVRYVAPLAEDEATGTVLVSAGRV